MRIKVPVVLGSWGRVRPRSPTEVQKEGCPQCRHGQKLLAQGSLGRPCLS